MRVDRHDRLISALRAANGPMSGAELGRALGVSTRTIRSDVSTINALAGTTRISSEHRGYRLRAGGESAPPGPRQTPDSRIFTIVRRLIRERDGLDVHELASTMFVSESSIEADLAKVRTLIRDFELTLHRAGDRIVLAGRERDQRRLVRQLVLGSARGAAATNLGAALHDLTRYDLAQVAEILEASMAAGGLELNDYVLADLTLHLTIALDRIDEGLTTEEEGRTIASPALSAAISDLNVRLATRFGSQLPEPEQRAFAALVAARLATDLDPAQAPFAEGESVALVRAVLRELSSQYLLDIDDEVFVMNLSVHVRNLLVRARSGQPARNPLGPDFKDSHPLVHELAVFMASRIEAMAAIAIEQEEIVYLALHLGGYLQRTLDDADRIRIVCITPRYYDTQNRFRERIAHHIDEAAVTAVAPIGGAWPPMDADLVVSTTDPPEGTNLRVVQVSPLLGRADLDRISDAARQARRAKSAARIRWTLTELLDPRLFLRVSSITKEDALTVMCETLVSEGVAGPDFLEGVLARERLSSTAFNGSIAVPHSLHMNCRRTAISVLISDEPIRWGESEVQMIALFALSPTGRQVFRDVLDAFIAVLAERDATVRIVNASGTYEEFVPAVLAETEG